MSRLLQLSTIGDEYRDAWERAVRVNPACGFMQSLTWAELQARQGVEVYPRLWLRDGRIEGGAIFQAARSLDGPGILVTPGGPLVPWHDPERAAVLFAAIRREACRLRRRTGSILWRIEPRLAPPLPPYVRGFVRAPVDLDPFETNELDLSGGMADVLARMTSKGRYNVGLARRHGVEVEVTTDPASAARFHPLLAETAARQGFAAEPVCYLMDLAATLFPARMAAAFFATYRGETLAAGSDGALRPSGRHHGLGDRSRLRHVRPLRDRRPRRSGRPRVPPALAVQASLWGREPRLRRRTRPVRLPPDRRCDAPLPAAPGSRGGTRLSVRSLILHTTFVAAGLMAGGSIP
jgi:hypothetical protein